MEKEIKKIDNGKTGDERSFEIVETITTEKKSVESIYNLKAKRQHLVDEIARIDQLILDLESSDKDAGEINGTETQDPG